MGAVETNKSRTYGNWRRPVSAGLASMSMLATGLLLIGAVTVIATMMFAGLVPAGIELVVLAAVLWVLTSRDRHELTLLQRVAVRVGWWRSRATGAHLYRSGPLGQTAFGSFQLPGLLAASEVTEWRDALDRPFALVRVPASGLYSLVLTGEPDGGSLVDEDQVDGWVAHWGNWLKGLGDESGMVGASVTIETAPDSGARLRREVFGAMDHEAPALAQEMLREVVASYPVGSATVRAYATISFSSAAREGVPRRKVGEVARDLSARLPALCEGLQRSGAGVARPVSAQELCEVVRIAYDPGAAQVIDSMYADGETPSLAWSEVGPAAAQADWDAYRHDGAFSCSWAMSAAPRGVVLSSVLARLLSPHGVIDRKRVTLLYRPKSAGRASQIAEQDRNTANFRATASKRPSARLVNEQRAATSIANDEAAGAGVVDFGMLVTATVTDADRLPEARQTIADLAGTARLALRPLYGSQDSAFAATLPVGLVLARHINVPDEIRRIA